MKFGELNPGKYLGKVDFPGPGKLVTIKGYTRENVAMEEQPPEVKPIIHFFEFDRGMVLNETNKRTIYSIFGFDDTSDVAESLGKKIVVYVDPTVMMGKEAKGGLRIRAPKNQPAPQPPTHGILGKPANRPEPEPELPDPIGDDVPF